ncbi:MAG: branched-chain amino acid aminotransferase [Acidobacteriaceae bacterium]|nr:branched-chain amino acid aminotransferase [Acidobacteriaceae bacterium]
MIIKDLSKRHPPQSTLDPKKIVFGKTFAPNLFMCEYRDGQWQDGRIEPLRQLSLHPAALVLHYAQAVFEGMKAFRQADGSVALFRPEQNAQRLNRSAERMCMPNVEEDLFLAAVSGLTRVEEEFVIPEPGSLYLRPVMIGTEASIGVRSSNEFLFYVMALPSGAYFPEAHGGPGAVHVLISDSVVRAAPGGTGAVKAAANYAVTLKVISDARRHECAQVLFLDTTPDHRVEEMGGMNIMFVENGTVVTPPLNETILPGVIRDSVLTLAQDLEIPTREEAYSARALTSKLKEGSIQEAFACGTAATITGIASFKTERGEMFSLPSPGPITEKLYRYLVSVQYGHAPDKHGWLRSVVEAKSLV